LEIAKVTIPLSSARGQILPARFGNAAPVRGPLSLGAGSLPIGVELVAVRLDGMLVDPDA
jgi:hypothetical protein